MHKKAYDTQVKTCTSQSMSGEILVPEGTLKLILTKSTLGIREFSITHAISFSGKYMELVKTGSLGTEYILDWATSWDMDTGTQSTTLKWWRREEKDFSFGSPYLKSIYAARPEFYPVIVSNALRASGEVGQSTSKDLDEPEGES